MEDKCKEEEIERLLCLEHELEDMMRMINLGQADSVGSRRPLDEMKTMREKEDVLINKGRKCS